jgi:glutaconyl-CoA/methylmalonyl-CoA decarboxylase subunit gamma
MKLIVRVQSQSFEVEIENIHTLPVIALVDGQRFEVWPEDAAAKLVSPLATLRPAAVLRPTNGTHRNGSSRTVYAPIPGVILAVSVKSDEVVSVGQELCVLEAMKMKQSIRAARAGQIAAVHVAAGETVKHHALLVEYTEDAS